jgi:hypothetical protein
MAFRVMGCLLSAISLGTWRDGGLDFGAALFDTVGTAGRLAQIGGDVGRAGVA